MIREFQHALRALRKHPGPSLVAVLVLALGIGANTVVFSLVNGLLLAPLDFERPEELVRIFGSEPARNTQNQRISLTAIDSLIEATREAGTKAEASAEATEAEPKRIDEISAARRNRLFFFPIFMIAMRPCMLAVASRYRSL